MLASIESSTVALRIAGLSQFSSLAGALLLLYRLEVGRRQRQVHDLGRVHRHGKLFARAGHAVHDLVHRRLTVAVELVGGELRDRRLGGASQLRIEDPALELREPAVLDEQVHRRGPVDRPVDGYVRGHGELVLGRGGEGLGVLPLPDLDRLDRVHERDLHVQAGVDLRDRLREALDDPDVAFLHGIDREEHDHQNDHARGDCADLSLRHHRDLLMG